MRLLPARVLPASALLVLLCAFRCSRGPDCAPDAGHTFRSEAAWEPGVARYRTGDTLWFRAALPNVLRDTRTGQDVPYYRGITQTLLLYRLDSVQGAHLPAAADFRFVPVAGALADPSGADRQGFRYAGDSAGYALRIGLVALRPGLYAVLAQNAAGGRGGTPCDVVLFESRVVNADRFLTMYRTAMGAAAQPDPGEQLFCFRVE
ncbi:MAG: hypothetical protein EOO11_09540 [Chitinophagaceae bacterium]|nr:MAG: hypothetical protein EOO11_09540 [Chitinophagaceae bacterium]